MTKFRPGVRLRYSDGRIYQVAPDGSYRREDGGKMGKVERKAAKKRRIVSLQGANMKTIVNPDHPE